MRISKHKSISWNILDESGNQIASLHADVRADRGTSIACDVFNMEKIDDMGTEFAGVKESFRAEVETMAGAEGAVIV